MASRNRPLGLLSLLLWSCLGCSEAPESTVAASGGSGSGDVVTPGTVTVDVPKEATVRFDPDKASHTDVKVSEVRAYVIRVVVEGEGELPGVKLSSSCGCLSASLRTPLTRDGAEVEVRIEGDKFEDIDGVIYLESEDGEILAEHVVTILIDWGTYVLPRVVELEKGQEQFLVGVYRAFPPRHEDPILDLADFQVDEALFELRDMDTEGPERITPDYLRLGYDLTFHVLEAGRTGPLDSVLELLVAEPEDTFRVPIRRKDP